LKDRKRKIPTTAARPSANVKAAMAPYGMTTGPDGRIWFVDSGNAGSASIGRMTTAGAITAAGLIPFPDSSLGGTATLGPDGNMWVQHLAKVPVAAAPTSDITSYTLSSGNGGFASIASGPDGRLWFGQNHSIGTSTTDGTTGTYSTSASSSITGVLVGPDSKIWYAAGSTIARMSTTGVVGPGDVFTLPVGNSGTFWMTVGPDGNVWFTQSNPAAVGRITPAGVITIFPTPTTGSLPFGIAAGPDGQLWFVERNADNIGSIPTSATSRADITEYPVGGANVGLEYIVAGPDKRMWFNRFNTQSLGAITTSAPDVTAQPVTPPVLTPPVLTSPAVTPTPPTDPTPPAPLPIRHVPRLRAAFDI
jgi:streptogramin lyase